jgi:YbbR domain-containing protein
MRFNLRQNLYLKIFSLLLAIVCWYVVRSEEERIKDFTVPLEYVHLPPSLELSGRVIDSVAVRLRAPEPLLKTITEDRLYARVDLAHVPLGEQYIQLTPEMFEIPGGAVVSSITPDLVPVRLERRQRREVPVVAEFAGTPPPGYQKVRYVIDPPSVAIEGPSSEVTRVTRAMAGTIVLDGQTSDYEVAVTPIPDAPTGSRVRIVSPVGPVHVVVTIAPTSPAGPAASPTEAVPRGGPPSRRRRRA